MKIMKLNLSLIVIIIISILVGIIAGRYIQAHKTPKIYLLNESRFITLSAFGMLSDVDISNDMSNSNNSQFGPKLPTIENHQIKDLISKLQNLLETSYKRYPIVIEKKDKNFAIYSSTEIIDITNEVIQELIGKDKWQKIGKRFLQ